MPSLKQMPGAFNWEKRVHKFVYVRLISSHPFQKINETIKITGTYAYGIFMVMNCNCMYFTCTYKYIQISTSNKDFQTPTWSKGTETWSIKPAFPATFICVQ